MQGAVLIIMWLLIYLLISNLTDWAVRHSKMDGK